MAPELSNREREVVDLVLQGKSNKMIAFALGITERTVEFHLKNIYEKHQVSSRTELILRLGKTTGTTESEKLGNSTVADTEENTENRARFNSQMGWANNFRNTVSTIGKELKMNAYVNSQASNDGKMMPFFESIRVCLIKYADFTGRATRPEFWWFTLFITLVASALIYLSQNAGNIFMIAMLLPFLAAGARRLQDVGKSAWWLLFILAPVGGIVLLGFLWAMPSISPLPVDAPQS